MNIRHPFAAALLALVTAVAASCSSGDPASDDDGGRNDVGPDVVDASDVLVDDVAEDTLDATEDVVELERFVAVGTYNVELFFDTVCDSNRCGPGDFEIAQTQGEFDDQADRIAQGIRDLDADIVMLQEIENQDCFQAIIDRLGDMYPVRVFGEIGGNGSIDVALLSIGELVEVERHRSERIARPMGGTTTFAREFMEVHIDIDGQRVIAIPAHFVSKASDDDDRRIAEARAALDIIVASTREDREAMIFLAGDLNDVPESATIQSLVLSGQIYRVGQELEGPEAATYFYNGTGTTIDYIMMSAQGAGTYIPGSASVVRDASGGLQGSDHSGVRAEFAR